MIITTLIVCFLLACFPLVIATLSFRYAANVFSRAVVTLSALSFLLGLAQFGLLLGLSYQLFSPTRMPQAQLAVQYVSIVGGMIMILAGLLWVGYFRKLIKAKPAARPSAHLGKTPTVREAISPAPAPSRKRKEIRQPKPDWFADEVPVAKVFQIAAVTAGKKSTRAKSPRVKSRRKNAAEQSSSDLGF